MILSASGLFIVMEGTDGSGTTTQGNLLAAELGRRGWTVVRTSEPSGGDIGRLLRQVLQSRATEPLVAEIVALLFAADRIDHCEREIRPALARGEAVVCDRYLGSSLAFQVTDGAGAFDANWIRQINRGVLEPDLSVLVDVPIETAMARIERRGKPLERFEVAPVLTEVRARYHEAFAPGAVGLGKTALIDGARPAEVVFAEVLSAVDGLSVAQ